MLAREVLGGLPHRLDVEHELDMPRTVSPSGIEHRGVVDPVAIRARDGRETGIEAIGSGRTRPNGDLGIEHPVQRPEQPVRVDTGIGLKAHHLAVRMHACIRASGDNGLDIRNDPVERLLEIALHRTNVGLPGVAVETRSVIGEVDPVGGHVRRSGPEWRVRRRCRSTAPPTTVPPRARRCRPPSWCRSRREPVPRW